jgi:hypothetical protein
MALLAGTRPSVWADAKQQRSGDPKEKAWALTEASTLLRDY